jgi:hypothetical protein
MKSIVRKVIGERAYRSLSAGYHVWRVSSRGRLKEAERKELEERRRIERIRLFKDRHRGEGCFIIGNGPSLRKMDLTPLNKYHTFGMNKIYLLPDIVDLGLSYYVAVNPFVIEQSISQIEDLKCPSFLSYDAGYDKISHLEHIHFIRTGGPFTFSEDLAGTVNEGHTVTYVAMQAAFYMGFREVILIGVDHNFTSKGDPNSTQTLRGSDENHFHPGYFSGQKWQLPDLAASEAAYSSAKYFYERDGRRIMDATVDGKLNVFQKISFSDALERFAKRKSEIAF